MSEMKLKPTRWYYLAAILMPIFACAGTMFFVQQAIPSLPGALEDVGVHNLTTVVMPGSSEISFPEAGAYAVYYEYRSILNGLSYVSNQSPPGLICQLNSKNTGESVDLTRNYIEGNRYTTQNGARSGVHLMSITIEKPGLYTFSCRYSNDAIQPRVVLAVGPNIVYEFFNMAVKPVAAFFAGTLMFICAGGVAVLMAGYVAVKRNQFKKQLASQA